MSIESYVSFKAQRRPHLCGSHSSLFQPCGCRHSHPPASREPQRKSRHHVTIHSPAVYSVLSTGYTLSVFQLFWKSSECCVLLCRRNTWQSFQATSVDYQIQKCGQRISPNVQVGKLRRKGLSPPPKVAKVGIHPGANRGRSLVKHFTYICG